MSSNSKLMAVREAMPSATKALMAKPNVVGVGVGYKLVNGEFTDEISIIANVEKKQDPSTLSKGQIIPPTMDGFVTDVFETGKVVAQQDPRARVRPVPGGMSIGHVGVTAGTLGCWVRKNGEYHILSNNHVIGNSNQGSPGDRILQPGPHDSGTEQIAELTEYVEIKFGGPDNLVDAAIARAVEGEDGGSDCNIANAIANLLNGGASAMGRSTRLKPVKTAAIEDIVLAEILDIGVVNEIAEPTLGMEVKKSGRTTGLTFGKVQQIDVTINVNFGQQTAFFVDQVITNDMSDGGDSGSAIISKDDGKMVGLLFAGSELITVFNRAQNVFDALDITF